MRSINMWAYSAEFGTLCRDAGLDTSGTVAYPRGDSRGQAGWHVAVRFRDLHDLATQLVAGIPMPRQSCGNWFDDCDPVQRGELKRLAIMAHGDQGGQVAINGLSNRPFLTADSVGAFHDDLHTVYLYTSQSESAIFLMGCLAGQGEPGTQLLRQLARVWPGRRVVGFSTIGYRHPGEMYRSRDYCEEPGMRDTEATAYMFANPRTFDQLWRDFIRMPWASDSSRHAKVVMGNEVQRWPEGESPVSAQPPPRSTPAPPTQGGPRPVYSPTRRRFR